MFTTSASAGQPNVGTVPSSSAAAPIINRSPLSAFQTGTQNGEMCTDESEKLKLLLVARMRAILSGCDADELKRLLAAEENGATLLDVAAQNDKTAVAKLLMEKGAVGPTDGTDSVTIRLVTMNKPSPFWAALLREQTKLVEIMLEYGQNPNEFGTFVRDKKKQNIISPLHFSAENGNLALCKLLVAKGANVNQRSKDKRGIVPLHIACGNGHLSIVRFFLESAEADIESTDSDGDTALVYALLEDKLYVGQYLISKEARTDRTDKNGISPLHFFSKKGNLELCKFLVYNGANVNQKTTDCQLTPLLIACAEGHLQIVKLLVEEGNADIESTDSGGNAAFLLALLKKKIEIARYLCEKGARTDRPNNAGLDPMKLSLGLINPAPSGHPLWKCEVKNMTE
ncbi:hypothetical protein niasHS_015386 [Heterodera schachtii]|uniref:ANK_REP_REGION domain-containing protein n=1 Tax=Heterodera schachtii TaxID=97005 RepID=A0ABD2HUE8_HETSC